MIVINYLDWWDKRVEMMETGQIKMDLEYFSKILQWMTVEEIRKEE